MIIGVTGSRHDRPSITIDSLRDWLRHLGATELHHGDCTGFDSQAHAVAVELGLNTISHPPTANFHRAYCEAATVLPPKPYLDRNKAIVRAVDFLIAAPDGPEKQRSGTWSTVRFAKRVGKRGVVLSPPSKATVSQKKPQT